MLDGAHRGRSLVTVFLPTPVCFTRRAPQTPCSSPMEVQVHGQYIKSVCLAPELDICRHWCSPLNSTDTSICAAWTIFETLPFGSPSATNWECRTPQLASKNTLYRNLPAAPTIEKTVCKLKSLYFSVAERRCVYQLIASKVSNLYWFLLQTQP